MRNSTGPSMMAKVCPWPLTNQRRLPRSLSLAQLGIDLPRASPLLPLPQGPFGRAVDAGVGIVAIEVEQLGDQGLAVAGGELVGPVGPQGQDQGPPDRGLGVEEDGIHGRLLRLAGAGPGGCEVESGRARRRSPSGRHPGDFSQLTMKLRSRGSALCRNKGQTSSALPQPDQGDGRPRLPLGQLVLGLFRVPLGSAVAEARGDLRLEHRQHLAACRWATGKRVAYAFGSASMSRSASKRDRRWRSRRGCWWPRVYWSSERCLVPEDRRQRGSQLAPDGRRASSQGPRTTGF